MRDAKLCFLLQSRHTRLSIAILIEIWCSYILESLLSGVLGVFRGICHSFVGPDDQDDPFDIPFEFSAYPKISLYIHKPLQSSDIE